MRWILSRHSRSLSALVSAAHTLTRGRKADSLCMCQMQLLQIMLCPAAILVCCLCASNTAYLLVLLVSVQLLIRAPCFCHFILCCVLFLGHLSPILLRVVLYTPYCRETVFALSLETCAYCLCYSTYQTARNVCIYILPLNKEMKQWADT